MQTPGPDRDLEFFIGYAPPMPPRLARFVGRVVLGLAAGGLAVAVGLGAWHVALEGGVFEFGRPRHVEGTLIEHPFPAIRLGATDSPAGPLPLLVAPGKHGADAFVKGLEGRQVGLRGTRIQRGVHTMIEIDPASMAVRPAQEPRNDAALERVPLGADPLEITGEIVDSKCFLGVMIPGSGKTHKDCASLCLRGGIPPALHVQDRVGRSLLLLLTGRSGGSIAKEASAMAGEAVTLSGLLVRQNGWLVLETDPRTWRRLGR